MASIRETGKNFGKIAAKVGLTTAIAFGSTAQAAETPQTSTVRTEVPCISGSFFVESIDLGDFVGAPVRIPANLSQVIPRPLQNIPGSEYFYPIYDPNKADAAHRYEGIGPHYGVAYQNLDGNYAADLFTFGNVGELAVKAKNGGRFAISFEHEFINQWQGTWYTDAAGHRVFNPNIDMAYWFEGLLPGQKVIAADPDSGRQLKYNTGNPVEFFANADGKIGVAVPKTCNADMRVQFVVNILNDPRFPPQLLVIKRGPNDKPELLAANSLPGSVVKPQIPGAY